ncbi:MAG: GNAT family N-acetyltransferase [Candidatus Aminicenantes bacterium]|nr:GNAT family N-acetyltransferase [Candidatus Aminicenantes bacterium]NIM77163.1 GNAT family N-acetyltransferase [Candidatus Aminicenantes bacterium]NIN16456.1 GNAT family N-acetyltransferase [Candidatus Aminicenantes bacterium]NIN40317.1 GNAT family N-acetyltransferase [Candidatus Aminicenantes bacterium]NIN83136.1 GNAT family N-acetyltransferase [Candidatus Aminicenantes bacterium]
MKIRAYIKGDEEEIMELDARELPSRWNPRTLENWYWKFTDRNPAGHAFVWVAEHQDHLVGHFAAVPYKLKLFDEVVTASHTIGALVDKKFQNRGLLKFVGEKLMEDLEKNNIPYTWGFPNRLAHKFENVVLKYNDLVNFDLWKIEKAALKKNPPNPGIRPVTEFDNAFDELWDTCSPDYEIAVVRNKIYLNWRYLQRPDWKYFPFALYDGDALKGYVVLKLYKEEETLRGHIIDIFARRDDEQTLSGLIDHSLNFFIDEGVDEITVLIWGSPLVEKLFIDRGFFKETIDRPLILRINLDHKYKDKILDNSHWYFTMGDSTEIF